MGPPSVLSGQFGRPPRRLDDLDAAEADVRREFAPILAMPSDLQIGVSHRSLSALPRTHIVEISAVTVNLSTAVSILRQRSIRIARTLPAPVPFTCSDLGRDIAGREAVGPIRAMSASRWPSESMSRPRARPEYSTSLAAWKPRPSRSSRRWPAMPQVMSCSTSRPWMKRTSRALRRSDASRPEGPASVASSPTSLFAFARVDEEERPHH